jgi:membrane peptidoglycan carboxypeptidase
VLVLVAVGAFIYIYKTTTIPDASKELQAQTTYVYYGDGKSELGSFQTQNRTSIAYGQMPQDIKDAVVAAEDHTFWTNNGIDIKGIVRAALSNAQGNAQQGASTITQQYVKVLYLGQDTGHLSYQRKLDEIFVALKIHNKLSKQQILEGYLNTIYFGRGAWGIESAAEAYFNVHAKQLNLRQAAVIASILNTPGGSLDPANGKDARQRLKARYDYTLTWMANLGSITQTQATKAERKLPKFPKQQVSDQYAGQKGHALKLVKDELEALGFPESQIDGGGLRVTTTLTRKNMAAASNGVNLIRNNGIGGHPDLKSFSRKNLHVAVAEVQPGTGALLGFYGGQNYLQSQINWAVSGGMAGSTMKAFTLATALEAGYSLKSTWQGDSPYTYPNGETVANEGQSSSQPYGASYGNHVSTVYALQQSINTAFIDMTQSIPDGIQKIYNSALAAGIAPGSDDSKASRTVSGGDLPIGIPSSTRDLEPTDPRITLGKAYVSPINLANAYATIANRGERADVHVINKVTDANGKVLYQYQNATTRAMPEGVADDDSYALQQVASGGTGATNASPLDLGRPDAGKTGTATAEDAAGNQFVSSAWYVGFTPQLATAVMYTRGDGNDSLEGWLPTYFGMDYPAATWTAVMKAALDGQPTEQFPPAANVSGTPPDTGHEAVPTKAPATHHTKAPHTQAPPPTHTHTVAPPPATQSETPTSPPSETQTQEPTNPPSTASEPSSPTTSSNPALCIPDCGTGGSGGGTGGGTGGG